MARKLNIKYGDRFHLLTVIKESFTRNRIRHFECLCDCGKTLYPRISALRNGTTKSCGCKRNRKHGGFRTPEHRSWRGLLGRCLGSAKARDSRNYRNRGISVCSRWQDKEMGFQNFLSDMGRKPSPIHSIDRIDNDGPYSPENCRWASPREQANNRRNNLYLVFRGKKAPIKEWSIDYGIPIGMLRDRIRRGWSLERSLKTPPGSRFPPRGIYPECLRR